MRSSVECRERFESSIPVWEGRNTGHGEGLPPGTAAGGDCRPAVFQARRGRGPGGDTRYSALVFSPPPRCRLHARLFPPATFPSLRRGLKPMGHKTLGCFFELRRASRATCSPSGKCPCLFPKINTPDSRCLLPNQMHKTHVADESSPAYAGPARCTSQCRPDLAALPGSGLRFPLALLARIVHDNARECGRCLERIQLTGLHTDHICSTDRRLAVGQPRE